jgi:heme/copper-type cytochrome/quinol oxidase subunit 3
LSATDAHEPPRSVSARTAAAAARVARQRTAEPNGIWGIVLFLCAEVALFGCLISTYFYLDFRARAWPPAGIERPSVALPAIATAALVLTSIPMLAASRAALAGRRGAATRALTFAFVVQIFYVAAQVLLFAHDLNHFTPQGSAYGSIYFTLLGAHHAHVLLGLALDLAILWQLATKGLSHYWLIGVRGLAIYWHVVNGIAVFVLLTQLSPSL